MPSAASLPTDRREWHGRVWRIAGPIILSNMSVPLLGAVDTAVVGHLPDPVYIGAVAVGAIIFNFLYWGFGFLRMGTTGFTAQAYGAEDWDEVRAIMARGLSVAGFVGLGLIVLQWPIGNVAFWLMQGSAGVESLAESYFAVRIWGAPAALANYVLLGWLLGMHRARTALVLQLFMNGLNIVLDLVFVLVLGWGVEGVALATVISEIAAAAGGVVAIFLMLRHEGGRLARSLVVSRPRIVAFLKVNGDIFIRTLCLILAFAYFTSRSAEFGNLTLAANAVLIHFQQIMAYGLDGFAFAAEALVGGAIGARKPNAVRHAVVVTTQWALAIAILYALAYLLAGPAIIAILTGIPEVREAADSYLYWVVLSPLLSVWSFQLDGIFIGATRSREMRNAMIVSFAIYLAAVHGLTPYLGNDGLWLALMVFMVVRAVTLVAYYPRLERSVA